MEQIKNLAEAWDDLEEDIPTQDKPKLCRVDDPECTACQ